MSREGELNRFITRHSGAGELDSAGSFSLDLVKCREKLVDFGLKDSVQGLLRFVQLAVERGSREIRIDFLRNRTVLVLEDVTAASMGLDQIHSGVSTDELGSGLILLACLKGEVVRASILSKDYACSLDAEGVELLPTRSELHRTVRIELEQIPSGSFWQRLREAINTRAGQYKALYDRLSFCPAPIYLDGEDPRSASQPKAAFEFLFIGSWKRNWRNSVGVSQFSQPIWLDDSRVLSTQDWDSYCKYILPTPRGILGQKNTSKLKKGHHGGVVLARILAPLAAKRSTLTVVRHGVRVAQTSFEHSPPLHIVCGGQGLDYDLSGLSLIQNRKMERLLEELIRPIKPRLRIPSKIVPRELEKYLHTWGLS